MAAELHALCFDAGEPRRLASFWSGVLDWETRDHPRRGISLLPSDDTGFQLRISSSAAQKTVQNRIHLDLRSASLDHQQRTVDRALRLGARHLDVGQRPEEGHVVLADPEGNEFCVVEPGNNFLADCGTIGALSCEGSRQVGLFWTEALGWPLVWDQDEETAIRSPQGGPKISWGGPPVAPKVGKNRLKFDLVPAVPGDQRAEVERLLALGATRLDIGEGDVSGVVMADPDGNEFCLFPRP
jgi:predicted enzyme related to lactoylglutathione lyase